MRKPNDLEELDSDKLVSDVLGALESPFLMIQLVEMNGEGDVLTKIVGKGLDDTETRTAWKGILKQLLKDW